MAHNLKRKLNSGEVADASYLLHVKKFSLGKVARHFGVNKPRILKSLGLWTR